MNCTFQCLFIYFEREREQAVEGPTDRETESQASSKLSAQSLMRGWNPRSVKS